MTLGNIVQPVQREQAMKKLRDVIQLRWGVYALRKKAERIGLVMARDKEAVRRALKERTALRSGAAAVALLGSAALGIAADTGAGRQNSSAPEPATTGQATREPIPELLIRGQLNLTPEERRRIRQSIEQTNVEEQPIPRAFAPAAGMTAPPELTLSPLPQNLQQISGIGARHRFARLKGGTILIVGEERLVAAMIGAAE
jgi:hypothetical protein